MTDLFDRLFPNSTEQNITIHAFTAAITDYIAGHTTKAQIIGAWDLDAEAQADLTALCNYIDNLETKTDKIVFSLEFDSVMLLAAAKLKYNTKNSFKTRLGL